MKKLIIFFYFSLIYYYLTIDDNEKSSEIIKQLYKNEKNILFEILKKYSHLFNKFNIIDTELLKELLSDPNESDFQNIKNILNMKII